MEIKIIEMMADTGKIESIPGVTRGKQQDVEKTAEKPFTIISAGNYSIFDLNESFAAMDRQHGQEIVTAIEQECDVTTWPRITNVVMEHFDALAPSCWDICKFEGKVINDEECPFGVIIVKRRIFDYKKNVRVDYDSGIAASDSVLEMIGEETLFSRVWALFVPEDEG